MGVSFFYRFMVWATGLELALARQSGNRANISRLSTQLTYWEGELDKLIIRRMA